MKPVNVAYEIYTYIFIDINRYTEINKCVRWYRT